MWDFSSDPVVCAAVSRVTRGCGVTGPIDPRDEMFLYNLDLLHGDRRAAAVLYFAKGWQIAATMRELAERLFGGYQGVRSCLDFASGYGRATRYLVGDIPPDRLWVSDVVAEAVAFQEQVFGVHGVVSVTDPEQLRTDRRFDLITVASLFSHLPAATFGRWLARLGGLLAPGGILAFSTLGEEGAGLRFESQSESRVLAPEHYGTAWVSEGFVRGQVAHALGPEATVVRFAAGLCGHQDLYLVAVGALDERLQRVQRDGFPCFPAGDVDHLEPTAGDSVELAGWAHDPTVDGGESGAIDEVRLWSPRREWAAITTAGPGGHTRWCTSVDLAEVGLDDLLVVIARNRAGLEAPIAVGTLRPFLADTLAQ